MANSQNIADAYTWLTSYKGLPSPVGIDQWIASQVTRWGDRFSLLTLQKSFSDLYGRTVVVPVTLGGVKMGTGEAGHITMQPLVMVEGAKRIVKTPIAGSRRGGTVKEMISFDDYRVRIWGWVVNHANRKEYPDEQVAILKSLWVRNEPLELMVGVGGSLTSDLFTHVVVESFKLEELKMAPSVQAYELTCVSDTITEVDDLMME